jgi:predicted N-acetyltransferase YhbS
LSDRPVPAGFLDGARSFPNEVVRAVRRPAPVRLWNEFLLVKDRKMEALENIVELSVRQPPAISAETAADIPARDALLDRAMGSRWRRKSSEKLRKGRIPSEGLALIARDASGAVIGTVRLWDIAAGMDGRRALLLGPLAVEPMLKGAGVGSALMRQAVSEAKRLGYAAIILVGDAPYYARFGFSAAKTCTLAMPGPYEKHRLLALELVPGALDGAQGVIRPAGRKVRPTRMARAV